MTAECPLCGADSQPAGEFDDLFFRVARGRYGYRRCLRCDCTFQWPAPGRDQLAGFYPSTYFWDPSSRGALAKFERAYKRFVLGGHVRFFRKCLPTMGRVLEVGCGTGSFLQRLRALGFDVAGVELSEYAADFAKRSYDLPIFCGDLEAFESAEPFDAVCAYHVLEHVARPVEFVERVGQLLRPGGTLVLQVPNSESWQSRVFGRRWYGLDPPRHLVNYGAGSLRELLARCGFTVTREQHYSMRDNAPAIASSLAPWLDPMAARCRGRRGLLLALGEAVYLGLVVLAQPLAIAEAVAGRGGSLTVCAVRK